MDINRKKKFVACLSIMSNVVLTLLKILAGIFSGSICIISEAIHSVSDLFASLLTFYSVKKSSMPADNDHPYGHGKYEDMAGFIEGILIILAAFYIMYESTLKIISGINAQTETTLGIIVMAIASVMNFIVSTLLFRVSKESNSIALYADGEHLRTDVYSSLGVLCGLILIRITGHAILDPVIAMIVAAFIYKTGYTISRNALWKLLDYSTSKSEIEKIRKIVKNYSGISKLKRNSIKARQTGASFDIDLILQFPEETTICECHKICDEVEKHLHAQYTNCTVSIHAEPACYKRSCSKNCVKQQINVVK